MLVLVPFAVGLLREGTVQSLTDKGLDLRYEPVLSTDWTGYWRTLCNYWESGNTFLLIEQDMSPDFSQLTELWQCQELYCGFGFMSRTGSMGFGLGQKFSKRLLLLYPSILKKLAEMPTLKGTWPATHWWHLNSYITQELAKVGIVLHQHAGELIHLGANEMTHPNQPIGPC